MSETIKILIVDDEFHARKLLAEYVSKLSFLELAGVSSNAFEAMNTLRKEKIDILLSDIQMPEITGIEFVRSLKNPPNIIFTTAYSEYAVESYELNVVDYLLKPIAFPRFLQAINKVIEKQEKKMLETPSEFPNDELDKKSIIIKSGYKIYKVDYDDIYYLEAMGEYVNVYTSKQKITTMSSLKEFEERLPIGQFVRAHKSYIVSIKHIDFIEKENLHIVGKIIHMGRVYKDETMKYFNKRII